MTRGVRFHARQKTSSPAQDVTVFYPFKIYQPDNFASFTEGTTFLDPSSGVGTSCNIDATKPTDFTAIPPTVNPTTDAWRFWSVRSGYCEVRPIYSLLGPTGGDTFSDPNNFGFKALVSGNTDLIFPSPANDGTPFDLSTSATVGVPLIIAGTPGSDNFISFVIWIQIIPDTSNAALPSVAIAAATSLSELTGAFPSDGPNLIPVGKICPNQNPDFSYQSSFYVIQHLYGHVTGRFPPGNGNFSPTSCVMNMRGSCYSGGSSPYPADLQSQIFYPGDCLWVIDLKQIYQQKSTLATAWPSGGPTVSGAWQIIFSAT